MEQIDLTVPETQPANPSYRILSLMLDWGNAYIHVSLRGANGEIKTHAYTGQTALTLMTQLNKADLSTNSLHRRILQRLLNDGVLSGTINGAPDFT